MHEKESFLAFSEAVKQIPFDENDSVLVCGDFKLPGIRWIKASFVAMNDFLLKNENLTNIEHSNNVDSTFNILYRTLNEAIDKFVPKKTIKKCNDPPWYNSALNYLKNVRGKEYKKCKLSGNFDSFVRMHCCQCHR